MNKKITALGLSLLGVLIITACNTAEPPAKASAASGMPQIDADTSASVRGAARPASYGADGTKTAVVYFSEPEIEDRAAVEGATEYLAHLVAEKTGADVYRIERETPYPVSHSALTETAKAEHDSGARPKLRAVPDLSKYDTVYLGYPIWWYDLPMPVYSFLESADLAGKNVRIFSTHGGSGLLDTVRTVTGLARGADVSANALTVGRGSLDGAEQRVRMWLTNLGAL